MDKSLFFLFLSFLFFWLILDQIYGNKYVGNMVDNILGVGSEAAAKTTEGAASLLQRANNTKYAAGGVK